jgi:thioredoxin 2
MASSTQIVCPHCQAVNRIPNGKPAAAAKCGKCKKQLFTGKPAELTDLTFSKMIAKSDVPVVVDFWADWCGPCKMMAPEFAKAANDMEPKVRFAKLDTQNNQHTAAQFRIQSIPNMILFKNGKPVAQQPGAMQAEQIKAWINAHM